MSCFDQVLVYTDGASRGNPGPAAIGYAIFDASGHLLEKGSKTVGKRTNNEAEYEALIWALEKTARVCRGSVKAHSDSELMVRQINREYRITKEHMAAYAKTVAALARPFKTFSIVHVPREDPKVQLVDELVNKALDEAGH